MGHRELPAPILGETKKEYQDRAAKRLMRQGWMEGEAYKFATYVWYKHIDRIIKANKARTA